MTEYSKPWGRLSVDFQDKLSSYYIVCQLKEKTQFVGTVCIHQRLLLLVLRIQYTVCPLCPNIRYFLLLTWYYGNANTLPPFVFLILWQCKHDASSPPDIVAMLSCCLLSSWYCGNANTMPPAFLILWQCYHAASCSPDIVAMPSHCLLSSWYWGNAKTLPPVLLILSQC